MAEPGSGDKSSWPEVVGLPAKAAKQKILADRPDVQVVVLPVGSPMTTEFHPRRVRGFVNGPACKVAEVPMIG
ncbi:hypothetical protein PAHAL_3G404700 [Panicum hallii]|jgi:hypothetical protein|uniref:Subtilisin-chymotrypsin inhibitor-2A n=1 Tax=Panicum hallii TaxID=206008 RepID=A0A2S3HD83_9POAL|nr:hypothetical protein PAHAL_3G404700 [Panicum hallii]